MSIIPSPEANFTPPIKGYSGQGAFRFWCQSVLPLVYDDSLSYYELLNKVVIYLNNAISDVANMEENVQGLHDAYVSLQNYVNEYFSSLDVQEEINAKLDNMAITGVLTALIAPFLPDIIAAWLGEHITPTTPPLDDTFTVNNAAALSTAVGEKAMILRTNLTTADDCNNITIGSYWKDGSIEVANGVNTGMAVVVCFTPSSRAYGKAQLWYDCTNGNLYFRSKSSTGANWTSWNALNTTDPNTILMTRSNLTGSTDCNDLNIGSYYKDGGIEVANGVNTGMAVVVCFTPSSRAYGKAQLWYD